MFESKGKRYVTRAISEELHTEIQYILWHLIDVSKRQGLELDYLQVFELSAPNDSSSPRNARTETEMEYCPRENQTNHRKNMVY